MSASSSGRRGLSLRLLRAIREFYREHGGLGKVMGDVCKEAGFAASVCALTRSTGLSLAESVVHAAETSGASSAALVEHATTFFSYSWTGTRLGDMLDAVEGQLERLNGLEYYQDRRLRSLGLEPIETAATKTRSPCTAAASATTKRSGVQETTRIDARGTAEAAADTTAQAGRTQVGEEGVDIHIRCSASGRRKERAVVRATLLAAAESTTTKATEGHRTGRRATWSTYRGIR